MTFYYQFISLIHVMLPVKLKPIFVFYLSQRFGTRVQFASVDVKLCPLVPQPPCIQEVAVVLNPTLDSRVLQHLTWGTLLGDKSLFLFEYFTGNQVTKQCMLEQNSCYSVTFPALTLRWNVFVCTYVRFMYLRKISTKQCSSKEC